ncbi:MAG: flagellin [Hyphomonadaceae bacterium]
MTTSALTLRYTTQMQLDIQRITRELSDLQRQVSSAEKGNDLLTYGAASSRLVDARGLLAISDARASAANQMGARFSVQGAALSRVSTSASELALAIRNAISSDDGRTLDLDLQIAFTGIISGLNESWNGQPLFAGERVGAGPIRISSLDQLAAVTTPDEIFDEARRHQTMDLGVGEPVKLADKASEVSTGLFNAMQSFKAILDSAGGKLGEDLTPTQRSALEDIAGQLDAAVGVVTAAEGRAGQLQSRLFSEEVRLSARSNLLLKEIGSLSDADVPTLSIQLSTLTAQYQATAKVFSEISSLSLLDYL